MVPVTPRFTSIRKIDVPVDIPKSDHHQYTFLTQPRHPVHNFINFVKFSSLGATLVYLGHQIVNKVRGTKES